MVSNVCGCLPWGGTLWTLVPVGTAATRGEPGAVSTVKASQVLAATPGLSS